MKREQFDHILRAAAAIVGDDRLTVIGSQAILGSFADLDLVDVLLFSQEVDLIPVGDSQEKRDLIDGTIGEFSQFHETFGVWAHGVAESTGILPEAWRDRLVPYESPATLGVVALCLEPHDLWVAKAMRSEPRDVAYCQALAASGRLSLEVITERLGVTSAPPERLALARALADSSFGRPTTSRDR
ncbi:MAG: DUF6036 family nucleotidyltransferase [Candidatus Dormibacteria bacterium]